MVVVDVSTQGQVRAGCTGTGWNVYLMLRCALMTRFFLIIKDIVNRLNAGTCWAVNVYY